MKHWLAGLGLIAAAAAIVHARSRAAERKHPPTGKFISVAGTRVHYVERGRGQALIFLHGNASASIDFMIGPLASMAATRYRVFIFDRPGYGYSDRIPGSSNSPEAQARLIGFALRRLGVKQAVVLGHSMGALVAAAMALEFPRSVRGLILEAGFLYPRPRVDMALLSQAATPVFGTLIRHTVLPLFARAAWPLLVRHLFAPAPVPPYFWQLPPWLLLRPALIRTSALELCLASSFARRLANRYDALRVPLMILAGDGDRLVDPQAHSGRLHAHLPYAKHRLLKGVGHMVHHTNPQAVLQAIDELHAGWGFATGSRALIRSGRRRRGQASGPSRGRESTTDAA